MQQDQSKPHSIVHTMIAPRRLGKALISVCALGILCSSSWGFAFLPHIQPSHQYNARHNNHCVQQRDFGHQRYSDAVTTPATRTTTATTTTTSTTTTLYMSPEFLAGAASVAVGFAGWLYFDGADARDRRRLREEEEARIRVLQEERAKQAYIEPRDYWTESELAPYDGSRDADGPILLAADGLVFNVYKGRNFYLPGCEYHIFAGRDATRLLARNKLEEETPEEAAKPLNMAERAFLATWIYTFKGKYDVVGKLEGFDPKSTAM
mmetsp:Transcript_11871/g.34037  ORF Transcript_11871/g.34037 Transcript_11871/m.34037 type:complete len:265 (-) Transcript_11871:643-1437(-)